MTINDRISSQIKDNKIVLYMKGTPDAPMCGFSATVVQILEACGVEDVATVNVLEDDEIRQGIKDFLIGQLSHNYMLMENLLAVQIF